MDHDDDGCMLSYYCVGRFQGMEEQCRGISLDNCTEMRSRTTMKSLVAYWTFSGIEEQYRSIYLDNTRGDVTTTTTRTIRFGMTSIVIHTDVDNS